MNTPKFRRKATWLLLAFVVACGAWVEVEAQRRPVKRAVVTKKRTRRTRRAVVTKPSPVVIGNRNIDVAPAGVTAAPAGPDAAVDELPPPPMPRPTPRSGPISGGVLNGKAISKPAPAYPPIARAAHAQGTVVVRITVDEQGNVISATPVSGHPLLQQAAANAVRQWRFSPTLLSGQPVKVSGVVTVNFTLQ